MACTRAGRVSPPIVKITPPEADTPAPEASKTDAAPAPEPAPAAETPATTAPATAPEATGIPAGQAAAWRAGTCYSLLRTPSRVANASNLAAA